MLAHRKGKNHKRRYVGSCKVLGLASLMDFTVFEH